MDPQLQDAANAIGKWFMVVEYGVVLLVVLVFLCFIALLATMYQVFRLRCELPSKMHEHVQVTEVPPQHTSTFRYGAPSRINKEESGNH